MTRLYITGLTAALIYPLIFSVGGLQTISNDKPINIGLISCLVPTQPVVNFTEHDGTVELQTIIKSIIISAVRYNVSGIQFHIFLDEYLLAQLISASFHKYQTKFPNLQLGLHIHSVHEDFHLANRTLEFQTRSKCQFMRLLFPDILPNIDKILYLDTDIIVTGNIQSVWNYFGDFEEHEICGLGRNNEAVDKNFGFIDKDCFGDIPHVPPKGVNSGVMLMNLEKMRKANWTDEVVSLFNEFLPNVLNDQKTVNVLFSRHPDKLHILPCHLNFMYPHCHRGLTCLTANIDPEGIQLIHGAGGQFQKTAPGSFYKIFDYYREFDMDEDDLWDDLIFPIKSFYAKNSSATCHGLLKSILLKTPEEVYVQ